MPLSMERLFACKHKNDLGDGEMNERLNNLDTNCSLLALKLIFICDFLQKELLGK